MKLSNIYKQVLKEGVGCDVFNDTVDGGAMKVALGNDLYYYVVKQQRVTKEYMSPDEFFNRLGGFERHENVIDWDDVNDKVKKMKSGVKFNMPYLMKYWGHYRGHEGRHRTLAAKQMGCKEIPVLIREDISESDVMELANKVGDLSIEDMTRELKNMGFKHFQNMDRVFWVLKLSKEKGELYGI